MKRASELSRHIWQKSSDAGRRARVDARRLEGSYGRITFTGPGLDGVFEQLAGADVDVVEGPTDQPCAIRDPGGNLIRINQLVQERSG